MWVDAIPSCLRNRFFPNLAHLSLGVLGVLEPVRVDLEEFDARDGRILESRVDHQGGTKVSPLMVQSIISHILISACSHVFLHIV